MDKIFKTILVLVTLIIVLQVMSSARSFGAPVANIFRSIIPETDSAYYVGTTTPSTRAYLRVVSDSFYDTDASNGCAEWSSNVLTSTGSACGSGSGSGSGDPFAWTPTAYGVSTSTTIGLLQGFLSTASSTVNSDFRLPSLSQGFVYIGSGGLVNTTASSSINLSWLNNDAGFITSALQAYDAWTHPAVGKSATTSEIQTTGGFLSTASSTINALFNVGSSTDYQAISAPGNPTSGVRLWAETSFGKTRIHFKNSDGLTFVPTRDNAFIGRNETGVTITKGSVVYINGQLGNSRPTIALADADSETTMPAVGIAFEDIGNESDGYVMILGTISDIDTSTSGASAGDRVFVSQTAGAFTSTRPSMPAFTQQIGVVLTSHGSNGNMDVNIPSVVRFGLGTSGSIPFFNSDGLLAQNNANLSWDDGLTRLTAANTIFTLSTTTSATSTNFFSTTASTTNLFGQFINGFSLTSCSGSDFLQWSGGSFGCSTPSGSGDVTAAANFDNDNRVIRSDGTTKGVQASGVTLDDSANLSGVTLLTASNLLATGSSTLQNFTGINATTSQATSTNLSASTLRVTSTFDFLGSIITNVGTWFSGLFDTDFAAKTLDDLSQTSLADPAADQLVFWDDSDTAFEFISTLTGLGISDNTLTVNDVSCTDCLNATEIEDIYLLIAGDSSSGNFTWTGAHTFDNITLSTTTQATTTSLFATTASTTNLAVSGVFRFFTEVWSSLSDFSTYIFSLFTGGEGITFSGGAISFDCSEVTDSAGDHLGCSGEDLVVDDDFLLHTGDVGTGVFDFGGATSFEIPNGSGPTVDATGEIAIDTTTGQLRWFDSRKERVITATSSPSFTMASSTLDALGVSFSAGTTTRLIKNFPYAATLNGWYCRASSTGSVLVRFGDGTNWTTAGSCSTTGAFVAATSNNTFTTFEDFIVQIGTSASSPSTITVTTDIGVTAD